MANNSSLSPTQDERVMAALAHASALLPMMGVIAPIIIWVTQKEKSQYVAFQALQAIVYQMCIIVAWFIGMGCYMVSFFGSFATILLSPSSANTDTVSPLFLISIFIPYIVFGLIGLCAMLVIFYGIYAAIMAFQGKPFRYLIIGKQIDKFMQPKQEVVT